MISSTPLPLDNPLTSKAYSELQKAQSYIAQGVRLCGLFNEAGIDCQAEIDRLEHNRQVAENMKRVFFPDRQ